MAADFRRVLRAGRVLAADFWQRDGKALVAVAVMLAGVAVVHLVLSALLWPLLPHRTWWDRGLLGLLGLFGLFVLVVMAQVTRGAWREVREACESAWYRADDGTPPHVQEQENTDG